MSKCDNRKMNGVGKFALGVGLGVGLGVLFAPKPGKETRAELKEKFKELLDHVKNIDLDEVREDFQRKIAKLEEEIADLDREKVFKIAKKKGEDIKRHAEDLVNLAVKKGTPVLEKAAEEVRQKAIDVTKNVLEKLENKYILLKKDIDESVNKIV